MPLSPTSPVVLCILDGWGLREERAGNAVVQAQTPCFDRLMANCPNATLKPSGLDVGLPDGQMGNSEVGHTNIGAGRVVLMDLPKIDKAIADGDLAGRPVLQEFIARLRASGGTAHLMGLLSPGGVHSHQRHIAALARILSEAGVPVEIHCFFDGRDVAPKKARDDMEAFLADIDGLDGVDVATGVGRFFALDRDNRWERVKRAHDLIVRGEGIWASDPIAGIEEAHGQGETDEFIEPFAIDGYEGVRDGDGILFANFRADRAREILSALVDPDFDAFDTGDRPDYAAVCGMVEYSDRHNDFMTAIFPSEDIVNTLGAWVSAQGKTQFRIAETEKYPHVTFFLNGGVETPHENETRYLAPSPKVRTYDLQPEMSADEVTEKLVEAIRSQAYDLIVVNYANPDMVGHTGDLQAAILACEAVDDGLSQVVSAVEDVGGALIVTADHGNCETMIDPATGGPHTAHTTNPVPVILLGGGGATLRDGGRLGDLAPTLLALMGLPQPTEMTGVSLLQDDAS